MAVAFVTGMQGDDPKYYRVISTPKHFAVHSGPEPTRHTADVKVSKHDELDTYLPAFRATVTEGKAGSVMCAYNSINGQPACANEFLLQDQLRGKWNFQGYVVSDCDAVINIFRDHHFTKTQPEASALAISAAWTTSASTSRKVRTITTTSPTSTLYQAGLSERKRDRHGADSTVHGAHEARHVRPAGDGSVHEDRRKGTRQRRASRTGARDGERIDGAAEKRRHAAAEAKRQQNCARGAAGRSDQSICLAITTAHPRTRFPCWTG